MEVQPSKLCGLTRAQVVHSLDVYSSISAWIGMSCGIILFNKWVLTIWMGGLFDLPITLTLLHMVFCSAAAFLVVHLQVGPKFEKPKMSTRVYVTGVLPIAATFAASLWWSNGVYAYLSVSFLQMLKALTPAGVYFTGIAFGLEKFGFGNLAVMLSICGGIALASYGELRFSLLGVTMQLAAIVADALRIVFIQILVQSRGLKLNPISTMYYVSPASAVMLLVPWYCYEFEAVRYFYNFPETLIAYRAGSVLLFSAVLAFLLNMTIYTLVTKTSALTLNVSGVLKDWALIGLSYYVFGDKVSPTSLLGYSIAFAAVVYYNYKKLQSMQEETSKKDPAEVCTPP